MEKKKHLNGGIINARMREKWLKRRRDRELKRLSCDFAG